MDESRIDLEDVRPATKFPVTNPEFESFRAALFRQRRLLLWLSFALVAYYGAEMHLGKQIESQGLKLDIDRPQFIVVAAWLAWAWALWRYWQYERTHADVAYEAGRRFEILRSAAEHGARKLLVEIRAGQYAERGIPADYNIDVKLPLAPSAEPMNGGGHRIERLYVTATSRDSKVTNELNCSVNLTALEVNFAEREGTRVFQLTRPYAVDYKAPYWLALLAPIAAAIHFIF